MQEIFEENGSKWLQGAMIWTPMLADDSLKAAEGRQALFPDFRVRHYWDPDRIIGRTLARTLNLKASIAWDVYLIYPPEHHWDTDLPSAPQYWMHQLDEESRRLLDPVRFKQALYATIEGVKDQ